MEEKLVGYDEREAFLAIFDSLVKQALPPGTAGSGSEWFETLLKYNATNGLLYCGLMTISHYRLLRNNACNDEEVRLIYISAWCVELIEASFVIMDDIMDGSETRRDQPCWHRLDSRGINASIDALLIEQCAYALLRKHFKGKPYYARLLGIFHKAGLHMFYGQAIDTHEGNMKEDPEMKGYTREAYKTLVKYKGGLLGFYFPWAVAVAMAGIEESEVFDESWPFLAAGAELIQALNDFLDVFGDSAVTGKVGMDISGGKLSWVIVEALRVCTLEQRQFLKENYGQNDSQKVAACKALFQELGIPAIFKTYEREYFERIETMLESIRPSVRAGFRDLFKYFKRSGDRCGMI